MRKYTIAWLSFCVFSLSADPISSGYAAPAAIALQKQGGASYDIEASFLYYYAGEGGLDLANSAGLLTQEPGGDVVIGTGNSVGVRQSSKYEPDFAVGLGVQLQEWSSHLRYTWIRQTTSVGKSAPEADPRSLTGVWVLNNWFQQTTPAGQGLFATSLFSSWHLAMDLADVMVGRDFFQSKRLIIKPFGGVRAAWIRQALRIGVDVPEGVFSELTTAPIYSYNSSQSWGLGPRGGWESTVLLGKGFSCKASAALALLFTQYTKVYHEEQVASALSSPSLLRTTMRDVCTMRPELDMGLGFGFASFLAQERFYLDIGVNYEFLLFWNQNMMRKLQDQSVSGSSASAGNLFLQGLQITGSFHF